MPTYRVTYTLIDAQTPKAGVRTKTFVGDFVDFAAASTAEGLLSTALKAAITADIARVQLTEDTTITPTPLAESNVFEVASATLPISSIKNANFQLPSPILALQGAGNSINTDAAEWTALIDNFKPAAGWQISDGEHVNTGIGYGYGKLIYVRSGQRFS